MEASWFVVLTYASIGMFGMVLTGMLSQRVTLGQFGCAAMRHLAAGVVFAATALELLPEVMQKVHWLSILIGYLIGLYIMLSIKILRPKIERKVILFGHIPVGFFFCLMMDLFIDGILLSVAFLAGEAIGKFIALAFAIEMLVLGVTIGNELKQKGLRLKECAVTIPFLALCLPWGALFGYLMLYFLPSSMMIGTLSFGVVSLMYLVTEELMAEKHNRQESSLVTACFFLGFLCILMLKL